ncbi:flavin-containing protein [Fusarium tjaetaba]|uniref:Flavin-containing protein n=1 Tax=Fusarium tjaetaba TaxID=1567544 RepID=A0A8H5VVL0_9HYPO|nr:flavin-containing protein [Fusarium tjaetaba]KAF5635014.1 flavin-containing protein [Fusarium tjaetaba]
MVLSHSAMENGADKGTPGGMPGTAFLKRKLKIVMLGAGLSGIQFAHDVDIRMENVELDVYEKNPELGGTWYENRYPGCACDVPAHTYQFSWAPNPRWSKFYAPAPEIRQYLNDVVDKHGLRKYMHFNHRAVSAQWQEKSSTWRVELETNDGFGSPVTIIRECDVLVKGLGTLNKCKFPDIEGLSTFSGRLMHTANWDETVDLTGKRIAVIGNGASAVQCVAALQPVAKKLVNYFRTASWMIPHLFSDGAVQKDYSAEDLERFENDPDYYLEYRQRLEKTLAGGFEALWSGSIAQAELERTTLEHMTNMIHDPQLMEALLPKFEIGCRRFTPGDHYLNAIQQSNVTVISDHIVRVSEDGIVDETGTVTELDVIVCATGFNTSYEPRFPTTGRNGYSLSENWGKDKPTESYMGAVVAQFPNLFVFNPPIAPVIGSAFPGIEATSKYILRLLDRLQADNLKSIVVKESAQTDFNKWAQRQLRAMAFSGTCKSWYKNSKGKVFIPWPGTIPHYIQTTSLVRWEDFDFVWASLDNKYASLGNGVPKEGVAVESPPWLFWGAE